VCLVPDDIDFCIAQDMVAVRANEKEVDSKFLFAYMRSKKFKNQVDGLNVGTTIPHLKKTLFSKLMIPLPTKQEQKIIGCCYYYLSKKIELLQKQNETLEKIGLSLFEKYVSKNIEAYGDWEGKSLDEIAKYLNGLALQKYPPKGVNDLPVIKIRELKQGITDNTDLANSKIPPEYVVTDGDILFSWSGSLEVVIWCGGEGALNQHLFKVTSDEYPKWFYYYWTLHHLIRFKGIAADKATTMGHIKRKHLTEAKVLIPPKKEIERLNNIFEPIINRIVNINLKKRTLTQTRDLLLPKLMSGKIRVGVR